MPQTATTADSPIEVDITDQLHEAVTSALDLASSTLFDDDAISLLSGFASAGGGNSNHNSRPSSPPTAGGAPVTTPPRVRGQAGGATAGRAATKAQALASVKEGENAFSPTSVRKTPGIMVPGSPQHTAAAQKLANMQANPSSPKPPTKLRGEAVFATSATDDSYPDPDLEVISPAYVAYSQARAKYDRSEAAAEERSALVSATGGVEVQMFANANGDGNANTNGGGEKEKGGEQEEQNVNRTRSEVELDDFALELESAIGLESGFSVTYEAAKSFTTNSEGGEKEEGGLPTTFEEEALQNEADMAEGGETKANANDTDGCNNPDNREATTTPTNHNNCDVLGFFGRGAAATAVAATATAAAAGPEDSAPPRFTLPTSIAKLEGFLTGLADSTNEAMAKATAATSPCTSTADCLRGHQLAKADVQNENDAIEVEALPPKKQAEEGGAGADAVEGTSNTNNDAEGGDDAAVRISTGPVDIDEVSHTNLREEFGPNELNFADFGQEGEETMTKKAAEEEDPAISDAYACDTAKADKSEKKKRVTIVEDPIEVASAASSNGASASSPDPIPRRVGGKTDEESTVVSLTFQPPSPKREKKNKNKNTKKQKMMAALGMTTAPATTTAAATAEQTTAAPTVHPTDTINGTTKNSDDEIKKSPKKALGSKKMLSSLKKALSSKKEAVTTIRMISGRADDQTAADVQNISTFELPNPKGRAGGACTSALLKTLYDAQGSSDPSTELTYVDVLTKMRADLKERGFEQIPQLTSSESLNIKGPFQLSAGKGTARALLVGINYCGEKNELSSCHDDVKNMHRYLTEVAGFDEDEIMVLMDDDECLLPSKKNIINAWKELVEESEAGDSVYFHFSGHGGRIRDDGSAEEIDGCDETICPVDYADAGQIRDEDIYKVLCEPMAKGVTVTVLMDSCHSGTVLGLPYTLRGDALDKKKYMSLNNTSKSAKYFGEFAADGKKKVSTPAIAKSSPSTPMSDVKEMPSTTSTEVSMHSMSVDDDDAASMASC